MSSDRKGPSNASRYSEIATTRKATKAANGHQRGQGVPGFVVEADPDASPRGGAASLASDPARIASSLSPIALAAAALACCLALGCSNEPVKARGSSSSGLVFARVVGDGVDLARARLSDGSVRALLETPDRDETWPYWSELTRRLAFEIGRVGAGVTDLRLWLPNSGEEIPFSETSGRDEGWVVWSAVAPELAFAFVGPGNRSGIAIADLSEGVARVVAAAGRRDFFLRPTFSPDGRRMVAQRRGPDGSGSNLWILERDAPPRRITHDPDWFDFKAWFTRDGRRILYSRRPKTGGWHEIASVDPEEGDLRLHAHVPESDAHSARPSPLRDEFAFVSNRGGREVFDLYLESLEGGDPRNLSQTPDEHEFAPRWSPNGALLVVTVAEEEFGLPRLRDLESLAKARIRVLDRTGRVLFETHGFMPDWMPAW
jgi:Tol biopolymer transport system component